MDPSNPESFNHRSELLSTGRTYHFVDQLPDNYDPNRHSALLCVHGFPDLWYGWRYQIGPWVRQGYRVIVPDMLGYGGSSKPEPAQEYTTKKLCEDLAALLDRLDIRRAVVIGHDWGSYVAGRFGLWYPDRLLALIMISVPYSPPSRQYIPLEEVIKRAPNLGYQSYFSDPKSSFEILAHLGIFLTLVFSAASVDEKYDFTPSGKLQQLLHDPATSCDLPTILTDEEKKYYFQELSKGMNGPLNYYRTSQFRHEEELAANLPAHLQPDLPFLFIWGTKDATAVPFVISKSQKFISRYQDIAIEGRGHWLMVEAKDEITKQVVHWLEGLMASSPQGHPRL